MDNLIKIKTIIFFNNLTKKYNNIRINYNYRTIRIYRYNITPTKTLYLVNNKNGDIYKNKNKTKIVGNVLDKNIIYSLF